MQHLLHRWRAVWNPDMYHGWGKKRNYFEGWYFKVVDPTEQHAYAFIPGISLGAEGDHHAFIQVLDGVEHRASYEEFHRADFRPAADRFDLRLGSNRFSAGALELDLPAFRGSLQFRNRFPWPKMLGAPGIMGWYSFVPFMECYHGIVSVDHDIAGRLTIGGREVDFTGGKGYAEKDWGRSFPSSWIWMQSNHFEDEEPVSLTASVARIPWLGSHFIGYIVGFLFRNRLHRFATYTGAMMQAGLEGEKVQLAFRDRRYRLEIIARQGPGSDLVSPLSGRMTGKVNESLRAEIDVKFYENEQLRFQGKGRNAGLEVAGPAGELLTEQWRR